MNLAFTLLSAAAMSGGSPALSDLDGRCITFAELARRAGRLAHWLRVEAGLAEGDRVALAMSNDMAYVEILYAAWLAGLCVAPLNAKLHPKEIAYAVGHCQAKLCFTTPDVTARLRTEGGALAIIDVTSDYPSLQSGPEWLIVDVDCERPAWLFYTSGTTGRPKAATLTHGNLIAMITSYLADSGAGKDDAFIHIAPQSHAGGLLGLAYVSRGLPQIVLPTQSLDAENLTRALQLAGKGSMFAVPTVVRRLREMLPPQPPHLHRLIFGGAPMYIEDLRDAVTHFGASRLWGIYGQGEAPCTITHLSCALIAPPTPHDPIAVMGSVGLPRSGVAVRIVLPDGSPAPRGQIGEVAVKGPVVMAGYWGDPDATATAVRQGWLMTGDLGAFGATGLLTLVDRTKDVVISGGSNIYPREVEEVLLTHPRVREAALVGVPDVEWGERLVAFIVASDTINAEELIRYCREHLAGFKIPRLFNFVADLPKSSYGKVLKSDLRERAKQVASAAASSCAEI